LLALGGVTACGPADGEPTVHGEHEHAPAASAVPASPTAMGREDGRGSFAVRCAFSHRADDDPIVHRGMPGMSHRHDFFGNVGTGPDSTDDSLAAAATTCESSIDHSAYWAPTLLAGGREVLPVEAAVYYRAPEQADASTLVAPPNGLELLSVGAGWACGRTDRPTAAPVTCPEQSLNRLVLSFPDCWDGQHLSSADHRSHLAAAVGGRCPASHPVPMLQTIMEIRYPPGSVTSAAAFSAGPLSEAHGDVLVSWERAGIERELNACVRRAVICDLTWNTTLGY
jgi:hypothetical protein